MEDPLIIPRLRLTRYSPRMKEASVPAPTAGPSRISPELLNVPDDDDDTQSTPRLSSLAKLASEKDSPVDFKPTASPADTPAARLRALLARVPNNTSPAPSRTYRPPSPSDLESDFEPVSSSPNAPSMARESLKELFSHALRDPGATPQKAKKRRNSIDASPRAEEVKHERAHNRGKRASMSDEEAEKPSHISRRDGLSHRSSPAAAPFDALRERLAQSTSSLNPPTQPSEQSSDASVVPMDASDDTATMLKQFTADTSTPPEATSTPMRSVQLPTQMQSQSNLLEQDSEMQRAMKEVDSYDGDSLSMQRRLTFPPIREQNAHTTPPTRPLSWSSHSKFHTIHKLPLSRRTSEEYETSSSRASSVTSNAEYQERRTEADQEHLHERERSWRLPSKIPFSPGTPERSRHHHSHSSPTSHASGRDSPVHSRSRRSSTASLQSIDDGRSSRASSVSSKSEYRSQMKEAEEEKNKERERLWNMPPQARARASSSLSMRSPSDRIRTTSTPTRPDSAQGYLSPIRTLHRQHSSTSLSGSSRASSPVHSVASVDSENDATKGTVREVIHIRERNWNSPQPKWKPSPHRRSVSPLPQSPMALSTPGRNVNGSASNSRSKRLHDVSSSARPSPPREEGKVEEGALHTNGRLPTKLASPAADSSGDDNYPPPTSPHSPPEVEREAGPSKIPSFKSRFGWQFPHSRTPLPPLELDEDAPELPPRSPSPIRSSSRIPVKSSDNVPNISNATPRKRGHRRSPTELTEAVGRIPPRIQAQSVDIGLAEEQYNEHDTENDDQGALAAISTPIAKPILLPPDPPPEARPSISGNAPASQKSFPTPDSPPPSPPTNATTQPVFSLQTPPRKPFLHTSKLEFQTPSPPRNMPELPGPPSSEEEDDDRTPVNLSAGLLGNLTAMKTPKPPGAWASTPVPSERDLIVRPSSTPPYRTPSPLATTPAVHAVTMSRTDSLPLQTPAPPGAWLTTPATSVRRKSILKVRFDVEPGELSSDVSMLESTPPKQAFRSEALSSSSASSEPKNESSNQMPPKIPSPAAETNRESPKSHAVRLVDAFGRETKTQEPPQPPSEEDKPATTRRAAPEPPTPRSRSAIRVVDAMGREVEEVKDRLPNDAPGVEDDVGLIRTMSHNEALALVRETIADLAIDLDEVDKSYDDLALDENRLSALEDASRAAMSARKRITDSLRYVQNAEEDLRKKSGSLRKGMSESKLLPSTEANARTVWGRFNTWTISAFLIIQLILMVMMYRYSSVRARKMFLTTYYDAFNADLYLHLTKPDTLRRSITSTFTWSIFTVPDTVSRTGWTGVASELLGNMTSLVADWQRQAWETWATPQDYNMSWDNWPPT